MCRKFFIVCHKFFFKKVILSSSICFHVMSQIMREGITKPLIPLDFANHHIIFHSDQTISWIERKTEHTGQKEYLQYTNKRKSMHSCWGRAAEQDD